MQIRGYPRIHAALIDLAHATKRRYGGVGFALNYCPVEVRYEESPDLLLRGFETLDARAQKDVRLLLDRMKDRLRRHTFSLSLHQMPPQHFGLGTKTTLLLCVSQLINAAQNLNMTEREIQEVTCRGGTSGVGIHTFFCGGLVADGGHADILTKSFLPSSASTNHGIPPRLVRVNFPSRWEVALLVSSGQQLDGKSEISFFEQSTPIPKTEALYVLSFVYHGFLPGIAEQRLPVVKEALTKIRGIGFKAREITAQDDSVRTILEAIDRLPDCAVGMSSLGPLTYAIYDRDDASTCLELNAIASANGINKIVRCNGRNCGYEYR